MFSGAPGMSEAGGYLCPSLCASLTLSPAAVPGPWPCSPPGRTAPAAALPPRSSRGRRRSAEKRAATPLECCGRRARCDPRDQAPRVLRLWEPQDPAGCSERETEAPKGGGRLLRSPEHQSQIPAHHSPSSFSVRNRRALWEIGWECCPLTGLLKLAPRQGGGLDLSVPSGTFY